MDKIFLGIWSGLCVLSMVFGYNEKVTVQYDVMAWVHEVDDDQMLVSWGDDHGRHCKWMPRGASNQENGSIGIFVEYGSLFNNQINVTWNQDLR